MSCVIRPALIVACFACLVGPILAQPATKDPDVQALKEKFQKEKTQAVDAKFPAAMMARAEDLAARGEKALAAGKTAAAARYFRDARWQLPYLPPGLPEHVSRVFGEARLRHSDRVNRVAYNAEGTWLASCSRDGTVKVWDLGNGREVCTYRGHVYQQDDPTKENINKLGVTSVAFHPKKKLIASACGNQIHLWDPETAKFVKTLLDLGKTEKPIKPIAFSPDGSSLAVGADDGILRVVDVESGRITYTSPSRNARIEALSYSPNGKMIVVGDNNSQIAVYAPGQMNPQVMTANGIDLGEVTDVVFTADNAAIFASGQDPKIRLTAGPKPDGAMAANTTARLRDFVGHSGRVGAMALSPDGTRLVTGGKDNTVRVWEVSSAKQLRGLQVHQSREGVTALAIRPDGRQIASGSDDGGMRLWDLNPVDEHVAFTEAADSLWAAAYSPDGRRLAAAGADKVIRVYDMTAGKLEVELTGAKSAITSLAFFPDSNRLAAAGGDQVIVIWDVREKKPLRTLVGHESAILSVAASNDGKRIISGSADHTLRLYSPESEKPLSTWTARTAVCAVGIHPNNKLIAAGLADGALVILDGSGAALKELHSTPAHVSGLACLAFSGSGQRLATVGGDGVLCVWTLGQDGVPAQKPAKFESPNRVAAFGAASPLTGVAFSREGRYVAVVGADRVIHIWDIEGKTESRSLLGHTDWVTSVCFSPDGRSVASVGVEKDRALRVFELPPLEDSAAGGHTLAVNAVAVSPDGKRIASAGTDQTIRLWDMVTGAEVGTLVGNADTPYAVNFVGNDALVMGGSMQNGDAGRLHFWSIANRLEQPVVTGIVYSVAVDSKGRVAAWAVHRVRGEEKAKNSYEIYDAKANLLFSIADAKGRNVRAATFSPDLAWAVTGDEKGNVAIWDTAEKKVIGGDWPLFTNQFIDIGLSPDKKYLVAADERGLVEVADVEKRHVLGSVTPFKSGVRTVLVSPTGGTFVTVSNDRDVKVWSLDPAAWKEPRETRSWTLPVSVNGVCYTPDGKHVVTANADGTAYLLELP